MIVTTSKHIRIDVTDIELYRESSTPGSVTVTQKGRGGEGLYICRQIELSANPEDMERFIAAYRRACAEDVGYRKQDVE